MTGKAMPRGYKLQAGNERKDVTVWYDSDCPLCVREIEFVRRLDRHDAINFVDIQASAACPIDPALLLQRFHAQERGQRLVSGAAAFAAMWRATPLLRPLGLLAKFPPVLWVLERLYAGFLKIRPWLQHRMRVKTNSRQLTNSRKH